MSGSNQDSAGDILGFHSIAVLGQSAMGLFQIELCC